MKIGILTYHRVVNDGAIVQAYCLQQLLQHLLPQARVEIIDLRSSKMERKEYRGCLTRRFPFVRPNRVRKLWELRQFLKESARLSSESCQTDSLDEARRFIHSQAYDAIVVGSDTVWEARDSQYVPPAPNIYFLPGIAGPIKCSFAVSADPFDLEYAHHSPGYPAAVKEHLAALDYMSVRDKPTEDLLVTLGLDRQRIRHMPDPTLMYDFSSIITPPRGLKADRPLAGINVPGEIGQQCAQQLIALGYRIVSFGAEYADDQITVESFPSLSERLGLYSRLDFLVTDRFHGSIFTMKLAGAPVVFVELASKWTGETSKGRDLFCRLDLSEMVWPYAGGAIPPDLIQEKLAIWQHLDRNVSKRMAAMQAAAQPALRELVQTLTRQGRSDVTGRNTLTVARLTS